MQGLLGWAKDARMCVLLVVCLCIGWGVRHVRNCACMRGEGKRFVLACQE